MLPEAFDLKLGLSLAVHENLRSKPRCRTVLDRLVAGLKAQLD